MNNLIYMYKYGCLGCVNAKNMSAFRSGGRQKITLFPHSAQELCLVINRLKELNEEYLIVGNCTKLLFPDKQFDKIVVNLMKIVGIEHNGNLLKVNCGETLPKICGFCKNEGLGGMHNLCGIPASLGGAIMMNAGAFGSEISDCLIELDVVKDGEIVTLKKNDIEWGYRKCSLKNNGCVVVSGSFELDKTAVCTIDSEMKKVISLRKAKQPNQPSLGSVFKRYNNMSAGYYIEQVGLKGVIRGGAKISEKHANFITNMGGAKSKDYVLLAEMARNKVHKELGILLEYETIILK